MTNGTAEENLVHALARQNDELARFESLLHTLDPADIPHDFLVYLDDAWSVATETTAAPSPRSTRGVRV